MTQLIDYAEKNDPDILHLLNEEPIEDDKYNGVAVSDEEEGISRGEEVESQEEDPEDDNLEHGDYLSKIRADLDSVNNSKSRNGVPSYHLSPIMKNPNTALARPINKAAGSSNELKTGARPPSSKESQRVGSGMTSPVLKAKSLVIDVSQVEYKNAPKIRTTLEGMKDTMHRLYLSKKSLELKQFDQRCYPYLLALLASSMTEFHSTVMQIILSTFDHFDSCNDAYADLAGGILDMYEFNHSVTFG